MFVWGLADSTLTSGVEQEAANIPPLPKEEVAENIKEPASLSDTENVTQPIKKSSNQNQTENLAQPSQESESPKETEIVTKSSKESDIQNKSETLKIATKKSASQNQLEILTKFVKEAASQNQLENVTRPPNEGMAATATCFISQIRSKCCISSEYRILLSCVSSTEISGTYCRAQTWMLKIQARVFMCSKCSTN